MNRGDGSEMCDMPEKIEDFLEWGHATCARFNRHGNLLAVGTTRGQVVLWDFDPRQVASVLGATNAPPVLSVSFPAPRTATTVLCSHQNGLVRVWDALAKAVIIEVHVHDVPHVLAEAHPRLPYVALLIPRAAATHAAPPPNAAAPAAPPPRDHSAVAPALVQLCKGSYAGSLGCCSISATDAPLLSLPPTEYDAAELARRRLPALPQVVPVPAPVAKLRCAQLPLESAGAPYAASFTRSGAGILAGGADGLLRAFSFDTIPWRAHLVATHEVPGRASIRELSLAARAEVAVVVSADRALRLYDTPSLFSSELAATPLHAFRDVVNGAQWRCAALSPRAEFVLGGLGVAEHRVAVWRATDGQLEKTLDGPREPIRALVWHPSRAVLVSLGAFSGGLYVWERNVSANWSAFAPDFEELEANEEYEEREDEFDLPDHDHHQRSLFARQQSEKQAIVDILRDDPDPAFDSDPDTAKQPHAAFFYIPPDPTHPYSCAPMSPPRHTQPHPGNGHV